MNDLHLKHAAFGSGFFYGYTARRQKKSPDPFFSKPLIKIPLRSGLVPKPEVPVFAVASSGLRVLS